MFKGSTHPGSRHGTPGTSPLTTALANVLRARVAETVQRVQPSVRYRPARRSARTEPAPARQACAA